jgi:hypothetical protein
LFTPQAFLTRLQIRIQLPFPTRMNRTSLTHDLQGKQISPCLRNMDTDLHGFHGHFCYFFEQVISHTCCTALFLKFCLLTPPEVETSSPHSGDYVCPHSRGRDIIFRLKHKSSYGMRKTQESHLALGTLKRCKTIELNDFLCLGFLPFPST